MNLVVHLLLPPKWWVAFRFPFKTEKDTACKEAMPIVTVFTNMAHVGGYLEYESPFAGSACQVPF